MNIELPSAISWVGYAVTLSVEPLRCKLEGQGFDSQSAVSSGIVRSSSGERAAREECRFVFRVYACLYTSVNKRLWVIYFGQHHMKIVERQNTMFCIFDMNSPRINASNIHESIHAQLRLQEDDIPMIQINGPRR